jgi:hypothetical protein
VPSGYQGNSVYVKLIDIHGRTVWKGDVPLTREGKRAALQWKKEIKNRIKRGIYVVEQDFKTEKVVTPMLVLP